MFVTSYFNTLPLSAAVVFYSANSQVLTGGMGTMWWAYTGLMLLTALIILQRPEKHDVLCEL